ISRTRIMISAVPVLAGFPPSKAVNMRLSVGCFSLSRDDCNTNSGTTAPSFSVFTSNRKCSFLLSV
uniref:Uncharacterized protein n=1 Tax=Pygocentrus nattereri TaxID=42514 RepID=A0AAR2KRF9_PYGNA